MELWERPFAVAGERVWRTWPGGRELEQLHGASEPRDGSFPEEWMLSTTRANNVGREDVLEGMCHLSGIPERPSLKQVLEDHPVAMLGEGHVRRYGAEPGVLVKMIDAQARLQLQVHPDKPTARRLFGSEYGKTECWHILALRKDDGADPCLYLGFRPGVREDAWRDCFRRQDSEGMLAMLHRIVPEPGQTFIVHGGVPHAIGGGCFLVEIQEPTDLTIRLEKKMPYGPELADAACHQGLGFDRMFECFSYEGKTGDEALASWRLESRCLEKTAGYSVESLVDYGVTDCFRMERLCVEQELPVACRGGAFSGLHVLSSSGRIDGPGGTMTLAPNDQIFVPAMCRDFTIMNTGKGTLTLLRFYGPRVS